MRERTRRGDRRARDRRRRDLRDGRAPRAPARRDDAPDARHRRPAAAWRAGERASGRSPRWTAPMSGSRSPPGRSRWAPRPRGSPTTTSARATSCSTAAFQIARQPVSNASWLAFSEGGGYERREWWSEEGWAWKPSERHHPPPGDRRRASAGARLPRRAGSRPTPSPGPTTRACPARRSGRRPRPEARGHVQPGSG